MNNPWDVQGPSPRGDQTEDLLFAAVGRALSTWEELEEDLADLFSLLVGSKELVHDPNNPASRVYGVVPTFKLRAEMLDAAAEAFFRNNPAQTVKDEYKEVSRLCQRFAARRNDIAHGNCSSWHGEGYYLVPGYYNLRRYDNEGEPSYCYCSKEILGYASEFSDLIGRVRKVFSEVRAVADSKAS